MNVREIQIETYETRDGKSPFDEKNMRTRSYKESLLRELKDHEYAAEYLTACLEESPEVFLLALRDVAEAQGDVIQVLNEGDLSQESLRRMFSENNGNPRLYGIEAILEALGFRLSVTVKEPQVA